MPLFSDFVLLTSLLYSLNNGWRRCLSMMRRLSRYKLPIEVGYVFFCCNKLQRRVVRRILFARPTFRDIDTVEDLQYLQATLSEKDETADEVFLQHTAEFLRTHRQMLQ